MKTLKLLNYERDRWVAGDGNLAEIAERDRRLAGRDDRLGRASISAGCCATRARSAGRRCAS